MEEEIRKLWDEQAKKFGGHPWATGWGGHLRRIEVNEVKRTIPDKGNILDLGCGNGYVLRQIVDQERNLTGIDLSSFMVKVAKKKLGKNSELIHGNVVFLPFKKNCFDYVFSIRTLVNVVSKEKQEKAINEAVRVLKTGGLLVLLECTVEGINNLNKLRRLFGIVELRVLEWWGHLFFEQERLEATLERNHVKVLENAYFPIITILEKVLYPKVNNVRGATRFFSLLYSLVYYVDRSLCRLFPVLGHDIIYIGRKKEESSSSSILR